MEPGSNGTVMANKLHITRPEEMDEAELVLLEKLYDAVLVEDLPMRQIAVDDLVRWHRQWLGNVYAWAGELRSVNTSKGGFMFAAVGQISRLLAEFEQDCLARYAELVLIHPFVEGNGRLARLLADVMAVQAGREPLDYSAWDADRERYFAAIRAATGRDYGMMRELVSRSLGSGH